LFLITGTGLGHVSRHVNRGDDYITGSIASTPQRQLGHFAATY